MKIYNEIVFDIDGNVTYEDSFEYSGDVMLCQEDFDWNNDGFVNFLDIQNAPPEWVELTTEFVIGGHAVEGADNQYDIQTYLENKTLDARLAVIKAQIQAGDIQTKAMPSLPSISNIGSIAPTGVVNWNAIPGGFQPLPQTAGSRKKLYQLSQFHGGINQKSSPRDIADLECQEATNVTVSEVGRIKLLGDCLNENNTLKETPANRQGGNLPGYGLFEFTAPSSLEFTVADCDVNPGSAVVDHDADDSGKIKVGMIVTSTSTPADIPAGTTVLSVESGTSFTMSADATGGEDPATLEFSDPKQYTIILTGDGDQVDALDSNGTRSGNSITVTNKRPTWIDMSGTNNDSIAQIYYASGNGVYVADASFQNSTNAKIYVSRNDINATVPINGWEQGEFLLTSPRFHATNAANTVSIETGAPTAGNDGEMAVQIEDTGTGTWLGTYYFYVSYLFDGGCETGLTSMGTDDGFSNQALEFNVSIKHNGAGPAPLGGSIRIEGARIYFKESGTSERWLLAEISLIDGVKGALDSTFTPWDVAAAPVYDLASDIIFENPPEVYSYASLNGYYANEVYAKSPDDASNGVGPAPIPLKYKTVVVGQAGIIFIGNVKFDGKHMPDSMMFSMPGKPGVFPKYNRFDSPSSDGSPIIALAAFRDKILQFKENALYVINVSNPAQFYAEASFRNCGVFNPCQVFTTSFGVIFANKFGCFIYDGGKVISLTGGKFDWLNQSGVSESASNTSDATVPCVGYDPRSQSIIVLKNIGDDAAQENDTTFGAGAWVYNMITQSWTEGDDMITNANGRTHTNFIITNDGYLSFKRDDDPTLLNYNHDKSVDSGDQTITYITKDLDFGLPSQTKKVFKVYVTYYSDDSTVPTMTFGVDGDTTPTEAFDSGSFASSGGLQTTGFTVNDTALTGIKSLSLKINGATDHSFEIQDISILYRVRPIK